MSKDLFKEFFRKVYFYCLPMQTMRTKWLVKHKYFRHIGDNFFFQPRKLPADPKMISFHNNVVVAADVTFLNHDVFYILTRALDPADNYENMGCIEVMDNVFIGARSIILPDVRIGSNVVVAAGSVVTKDIPDGSIAAGVPARVIGSFDDLLAKRRAALPPEDERFGRFDPRRAEREWKLFIEKRST